MGKKRVYKEVEVMGLRKALEESKDKTESRRILTVKAKAEFGMSNEVISKLFGYSKFTVRDIIGKYNKGGLVGIISKGNRGGRRNENMTIESEKEFLAGFESSSKNGKIATVAAIKAEYETKVGKEVPKSTITRLLARHGWRKILPRPYHPKRNIEAQKEYKKTSALLSGNIKRHWVNDR